MFKQQFCEFTYSNLRGILKCAPPTRLPEGLRLSVSALPVLPARPHRHAAWVINVLGPVSRRAGSARTGWRPRHCHLHEQWTQARLPTASPALQPRTRPPPLRAVPPSAYQLLGLCRRRGSGLPAARRPAALLPLDRFKAASGLSSSTTKTLLVCTQALDSGTLQAALPAHWRFIKPVSMATYSYLGAPIGKEVTSEDVFADTVAKLRSRVDQYLPLKGLYKVQTE
jgi:hypothetical protein